MSEQLPAQPSTPRPYETETIVDDDGVTIYLYLWEVENPRAVVHIAHGAGEHALRYQRLAAALNDAGYTVAADDHRGHGQTGLNHLGLSKLGPRTTWGAIASVAAVGRYLRTRFPEPPLALLGHSWGSLMAQKVVAQHDLYELLILSGTSLAVPGVINSGDLNKRWRATGKTGLEWLNRDPAAWDAFAADELNFDIGVQPVWNPIQAFAFLGRPPRRLPRQLPVLIIGGSDDSLGGVRGLTKLRDAYVNRSKLTDVTLIIYPEARHEIFNELNRDEVERDVVDWLNART
ncbi:lysophospholipase [Plantibacter flavus]|uniref:alpha/beta fold hydrolase n=1 Tax=Plantibacter flavus TaxID=150123 RepID=UPI003F17EC0C